MTQEDRGLIYFRRAIFVGNISLWFGVTLMAWFATSVAETMLGTAVIILAQIVPAIVLRMLSVQLRQKVRTLLVSCQGFIAVAQVTLGCLVVTGALTAELYFWIGLAMGFAGALLEPAVANLMTEYTASKRQKESSNGVKSADESSKLLLAKTNLRGDYGRVVALVLAPLFYLLVQNFGGGHNALGVLFFVRAALITLMTFNFYRCVPESLIGQSKTKDLLDSRPWLSRQKERVSFTVRAFHRVFSSTGHALGWLILLVLIKQTFPWIWYLGPKYVQTVAPANSSEMVYLLYRALGGILWASSTMLVCYNRSFRNWIQGTSYPESRMAFLLIVAGIALVWYPLQGTVWALVVGQGIASFCFSAFELAASTKLNVANENDKERVVYAVNSSILSLGTLMILPGSWLAELVGVGKAIVTMGSLTAISAILVWLILTKLNKN